QTPSTAAASRVVHWICPKPSARLIVSSSGSSFCGLPPLFFSTGFDVLFPERCDGDAVTFRAVFVRVVPGIFHVLVGFTCFLVDGLLAGEILPALDGYVHIGGIEFNGMAYAARKLCC